MTPSARSRRPQRTDGAEQGNGHHDIGRRRADPAATKRGGAEGGAGRGRGHRGGKPDADVEREDELIVEILPLQLLHKMAVGQLHALFFVRCAFPMPSRLR